MAWVNTKGQTGIQSSPVWLNTVFLQNAPPVIYAISDQYGMDFHTFYAMTGLWNCLFLILFSLTGLSKVRSIYLAPYSQSEASTLIT